ncbi:MAG: peptide deformylase [Finegoldia magna]|uniref:peptide deformylase n=1 Tax=Finegoldia magna TaxID=1260 RepID=UPI002908841C|nr:peptide deformylase [Finegoldia magna]MDU7033289.1 peptide deformylase [Finegoldia magna]
MALRQIRLENDPILRKKSREVEKIDDRIKQIAEDMFETMYENKGIGLACVQVGMLKRIVVIDMQDEDGKMVLINPKIIEKSEEKQINIEGCLSVPGKNGYVERPKTVVVEYTDLNGNTQRVTATDYKAHCFCHELDHLDGVLYTDKVLNLSEEEVERLNNEK